MRRLVSILMPLFCLATATNAWADANPPTCDVCWSETLAASEEKPYNFSVYADMKYDVLLFRDSETGDPDLYSDDDSGVSTTQYDCAPMESGAKVERCTFAAASDGTHYLLVHANSAVSYTVYVVESDSGCHSGSQGSTNHCNSSCVCGWELGDCDSDSECAPGLECVANQGANFGWSPDVDVCMGPVP